MAVPFLSQKTVELLPGKLNMTQPSDLTLFTITNSVLEKAVHPKSGIQMKITMKRKIMSEMMTTYFPSLLLMMITYATTFFKPFFFEAALSVNLTTMLVMTTIFTIKIEELPLTSDMKMIDIWLISCLVIPFLEVILRTTIECLDCSCNICKGNVAKKNKEGGEKKEAGEPIAGESVEVWAGNCSKGTWRRCLETTGMIYSLIKYLKVALSAHDF